MLLALCGDIGSGKSTIAKALQADGWAYLNFAGPLKDMLASLGLSHAQLYGDAKEIPCDLLAGASPRHAMQTLGGDWGRGMIHQDLWANAWAMRAGQAIVDGKNIIVDDLRYPNETRAVRLLRGTIWRVQRGQAKLKITHESERYHPLFDVERVMHNNGSIAELLAKVQEALRA